MSSIVRTILTGLQPNYRLAVPKEAVLKGKTPDFIYITTEVARDHPDKYITQLSALEKYVSDFIRDNPNLTNEELSSLKEAFEKRAKLIEGKWWLFLSANKRATAGKELRGFISLIDKAHAEAVLKVSKTAQPIIGAREMPVEKPITTPVTTAKPETAEPPKEEAVSKPVVTTPAPVKEQAEKTELAPAQTTEATREPQVPSSEEIPTGGAPPPPMGGAMPVKKRLHNEPRNLPFGHTAYKGKTINELEEEIKSIKTYISELANIRNDLEAKIKQVEGMQSETSDIQKNYVDPARAKIAILPSRIEEMVNLINTGKAEDSELQIGEGALPVYTNAEYTRELEKRQTLTPQERRVLNAKDPIQNVNVLNNLLAIAYNEYKNADEIAGKKEEESYILLDANGKEIIPIEVLKRGTETVYALKDIPDSEKGRYVSPHDARTPLRLTIKTHMSSGTEQKRIEDLENEIKDLKSIKHGEVEFIEFPARKAELNNQIALWNRGISNRKKYIDAKKKGEDLEAPKKEEVTAPVLTKDLKYEKNADKWGKVNNQQKQNLQISPHSTIIEWLLKGRFQPKK